MTKGQLHEEYRHPTNDEHREVRDEESTAAVLVTQIRETPKIPQSDGKRFNQDLLLRSITTCVHTALAGNRFDRSVSWSFRRVGSRFFALIFFLFCRLKFCAEMLLPYPKYCSPDSVGNASKHELDLLAPSASFDGVV